MTEQQPRPGHATLAGGVIIGSSIILVLSAWQRISTLHTLEVREDFQSVLNQPMWEATGLSVDGMATAIRVLCLVGAGAAAASTILGFQVFKRSRNARIVLTVLSPLLLIGGIATDGFLAPMAVAGIAMLWLQPTRDWYAGRPWLAAYEKRRADRIAAMKAARGEAPTRTDQTGSTTGPTPPGGPTPPTGPTSPGRPSAGPGAEPGAPPQQWNPLVPTQPGLQVATRPADAERTPRPQALKVACVLTWVVSAIMLVGLVLSGALLPSQSDELFADAARQQPKMVEDYKLTENDLLVGLYVILAGFLIWTVVAIVLAVLAFAGQNWARITLAVSAACAGALALVMSLSAWPLVILVFALAASFWLLLRPVVGHWYRR